MVKHHRVRVKFCGMTNIQDAKLACDLGVDAIGLIFHHKSPRNVTLENAVAISQQLPPYISKVAVFVDSSAHFVTSVISTVAIDLLQFHGKEPASFCRSFGRPYIKVIKVGEQPITNSIEQEYPDAIGFLFDTDNKELAGGTGQSFNWQNLPKDLTKPLILAGGLTAANLRSALLKVQPYAIDVTSGIEQSKGHKDPTKMKFFMDTVMDYCKRS